MTDLLSGRIVAILSCLALSGCVGVPEVDTVETGGGGLPVVSGSSITENSTPVDTALVCYGEALRAAGQDRIAIGVGEVRDFTGRVSDAEGAVITQGAGLMIYSALARLGPSIRVHERLDPRVAELELGYLDRQRLGDGRMHRPSPDAKPGPWLPYMGGSILETDYYIVGGVTELNNALSTGGAEAMVGGVGARSRYVVINSAVDLRIVNTKNLVVEHAVSMQKQIVGYETEVDVFRFFDSRLFDIKAGTRMAEPVQMAVRSVLQLATLDLLEAVTGVSNEPCVRLVQPDLDRTMPRPQGSPGTRNWPPDPATAVTAQAAEPESRVQGAAIPPPVVVAQAPEPEPQTPPEPMGAVVIGAATNAEAARGVWTRLREQNPDLLSRVAADIVSVNREGGPFLVVVEDPAIRAEELCTRVRNAGMECAVAPPEVMAARAAARRSGS